MGYTRDGSITNFWPDDDDKTMYIDSKFQSISFSHILEKAKEKWGEHISLYDLEVEAQNIHTHCIYYDCHDSGDYTDFLVITYNAPLV